MGTLLLLEVALPSIVESYRDMDEENADLTALLRLLGSLDAYRRTYRSRAYIDRIAQLILEGNANPSSVSFCLRNLQYAIGTLSISGERNLGQHLLNDISRLIENFDTVSLINQTQTDYIDSPNITELPAADKIEAELNQWTLQMETIHGKIEDVFFSHQVDFARAPVLFEIG